MRYPVKIEKIEGEFVATISHPEGRFQGVCAGATRDETMAQLGKLIAAMVVSAIKNGDTIPAPSTCEHGNAWVMLPPILSAKTALYSEMKNTGKRKADIARALNLNQKQVDRILDPQHNSTLSQLEAAANSLGKHLDVRLA